MLGTVLRVSLSHIMCHRKELRSNLQEYAHPLMIVQCQKLLSLVTVFNQMKTTHHEVCWVQSSRNHVVS